jgi:hypothetical protein
MRRMIGGIVLLMLALTIISIDADPVVKWILPEDNPEYLPVGEEFEFVIEELDTEILALKPTRIKITVGEAVEGTLIVIRYPSGLLQRENGSKNLEVSISLLSPPQSIRLAGVVPTRFHLQKVRLIALHFFHGDSLLGEFSIEKEAAYRGFYEDKKMREVFQYIAFSLVLVVAILVAILVKTKKSGSPTQVLNQQWRR